ncbi:MAG: hypothetical protein CBD52_003500 [Euryarchaeota archaeon TMED192]|nr:MAG: hypothetical protein CBD52_003500 [Euryarchaeota archaeon TMED192]
MKALIPLLAAALIMLPPVTAHEAKDYTILLTSEGTSPDSVPEGVLVTTDRLFFMMVDNRNDTRHMVAMDVDNDGFYDGPDDLSSPWLTSSCELDEEGNKTDSECKVTYTLILGPENGILPGNISLLIKINENENITNHTLNASFAEDVHMPPQNLQPVDDSQPEAEPEATITDEWLSRVAMVGILIGVTMAIITISALIRDKK